MSRELAGDAPTMLAGTHYAWLRRDRERAALQATWAEWFAGYDVLLAPVMCTPAFPHVQDGDFLTRELEVNGETRPYLELRLVDGHVRRPRPAVAVPPMGRTAAGLPVGVQVVRRTCTTASAVRTAGLIAEVAGGYDVPPGC